MIRPRDENTDRISIELERAEAARAAGNEGKARVCARRAAGMAIQFHYRERFGEIGGPNTLKLLRRFLQAPDTPEPLRAAAKRLTTRLGADRTMPFSEDLLQDARNIVNGLHELTVR